MVQRTAEILFWLLGMVCERSFGHGVGLPSTHCNRREKAGQNFEDFLGRGGNAKKAVSPVARLGKVLWIVHWVLLAFHPRLFEGRRSRGCTANTWHSIAKQTGETPLGTERAMLSCTYSGGPKYGLPIDSRPYRVCFGRSTWFSRGCRNGRRRCPAHLLSAGVAALCSCRLNRWLSERRGDTELS